MGAGLLPKPIKAVKFPDYEATEAGHWALRYVKNIV